VIRKAGIVAVVVAALTLSATIVLAQSGHFVTGGNNAPTCTDLGTTLRCTGKVAGLGGETFRIDLVATGTVIVQCRNPGGNVAPGQNTTMQLTGSTGTLSTPQNGQYRFTISTTQPQLSSSLCPNPQWTPEAVDVIFTSATLILYEDNVEVDRYRVF
jgi:hypothetical protein